MALFTRTRLFGLLFLLSLPLEGAAALAVAAAQQVAPSAPMAAPVSGLGAGLSLEQRLQRIALAVERRQATDPPGPDAVESESAADGHAQAGDDRLAYMFVNAPAVGWGNGGFRNGGFYNGGFRNGGFYNGGFRNGGFHNGGFRNGGGWRNGGFRNGGFRNAW